MRTARLICSRAMFPVCGELWALFGRVGNAVKERRINCVCLYPGACSRRPMYVHRFFFYSARLLTSTSADGVYGEMEDELLRFA